MTVIARVSLAWITKLKVIETSINKWLPAAAVVSCKFGWITVDCLYCRVKMCISNSLRCCGYLKTYAITIYVTKISEIFYF